MATLLTPDETPEQIEAQVKQRAIADEAHEVLHIILEGMLESYAQGELTLKKALDVACRAVKAEGIEGHVRQKKLGAFVEAVMSVDVPARAHGSTRSQTQWLSKITYELVQLVRKRENLKIQRGSQHGKTTAFERVSNILNMRGIVSTASKVERAYTQHSAIIRSKSK